jgi:hypothetical protein
MPIPIAPSITFLSAGIEHDRDTCPACSRDVPCLATFGCDDSTVSERYRDSGCPSVIEGITFPELRPWRNWQTRRT